MIKSPFRSSRIGGLFAVSAVLLAGLAIASPASAATAGPAKPPPPKAVTWTDQAGHTFSARALTAAEIKADGLTKYVDMSKLTVTTPTVLTPGNSGGAAATAQRAPPPRRRRRAAGPPGSATGPSRACSCGARPMSRGVATAPG